MRFLANEIQTMKCTTVHFLVTEFGRSPAHSIKSLLLLCPWSLCPLFFRKFLFFTKRWTFKNYERCFLFYLKSSFRSRDIQIFVFPSSPLFLPVSHCFRGWSKINLKVYDIINCLNKNLKKHFVWYLEKEKRYHIETLSIDRALNKENVYEKIMQKMCTKS